MIIDVNGECIEESQAVVSVYDHGFLYGLGLFETFRTYGGHPFLLEWHLERLASGCRELDIDYEPDLEAWSRRISRLLEVNQLPDAYFRLTVTAGMGALGLPSGTYEKPEEVLYVKPLPPVDPAVYHEGKALQLLRLRRNTPEGVVRLKSLHYMNNVLAKKEMKRYPWAAGAEGLFLDTRGRLCEGIVSNIFFVRHGGLYTPAVETGLLPGITRRFVMAAAQREGIDVSEGLYDWADLLEADEVFVTNSVQELVPVTTLFDETGAAHRVGLGIAGPITQQLLQVYRKAAARRNDRV
ncbi:aminodeoxychorismate lyase [Paenibacillus naphthalenovorans]|uniref:aminodeoxychorismate lyase n=1 Tax=Paenibacillus naphthalenovorans TaxID=162209 RepID=UPI000889A4C5|nr:aminodeoxychorismate lyase [Paenibacillus naphthalenovorans]SDJ90459.1 4-amino-4-deoxychorismate lyase [Paenibacillus naphthalenovorans]